MRILYLVGREVSYPRNDVILRAFHRFADVDIVAIQHKPTSLFWNSVSISIKASPKLLSGKFDLIFVGFYGQIILLLTCYLARHPILFDAFLSTYDTLTADRGIISANSILGRLAFFLDRKSCQCASSIILDTAQHIPYFTNTFNISSEKFYSVPVGCNEEIFFPRQSTSEKIPSRVLYYNSYLPLHGVETVVEAAQILSKKPIIFRLIGRGQTYEKIVKLAEQYKLKNIEFFPQIPLVDLPDEIASADICLGGPFGLSEKAHRVIPGKIYQILAMARPMIAGNTPANSDLLRHGETVLLTPPGDASALADAIMELHQDSSLREQIGSSGYQLYREKCSEAIITDMLRLITTNLIENKPASMNV